MEGSSQILALIESVRARWRRLVVFRAVLEAGLLVAGVLAIALLAAAWTSRWPLVLAVLGVGAAGLVGFAILRGFRSVGPKPSNARVARFIEESDPALDDRLASAVDLLSVTADPTPGFAGALVDDAARRVEHVDPREVVPSHRLRNTGLLAAGVVALIAAIGFLGRDVVRESRDALTLALFPSRVTLEVLPGTTRVRAGEALTIEARLVGNRAPVDVVVLRAPEGTDDAAGPEVWETFAMAGGAAGAFTTAFDSISEAFRYRVVAGTLTSPVFDVAVTHPPRVARIDIDYEYPPNLGLQPRTDEDGGDIYAPSGTNVRLRVQIDGEVNGGRLAIDDGSAIALAPGEAGLTGSFTVARDGTYRVALVDAEGVEQPASSEYFIRMQDDRPPDVRVLRPARDREVTALEEVEIEVEARDDFGLDRLELVYAVGGGPEHVVRLTVPRSATTATAGTVLYLEDLKVAPGDFVTYFVRARDVGRAARSTEARSDIFFLEVRPFDQQFRMANSQAGGGGGGRNESIDQLVAAQKEIIVATWKLDRRAGAANDTAPEQDVRAVAQAEAEVQTRVSGMTSSLRTNNMRDPRRPGPTSRLQIMPGEESLVAAAEALGRAVDALNRLETADALPAEMQALDHLLEAQAQAQDRQVTRQQAGGAGSNRSNQDLSGLFDRELQREQRTNYETRESAQEQQPEEGENLLERIRQLAERQDELLREQRELDRQREQMAEAERQRALERLSREQQELRARAEQLARELGQSGRRGEPQQGQQSGQAGQSGRGGNQSGQSGRPGETGQRRPGEAGQSGQGSTPGERMQAAAEAMRNAAEGMRSNQGEAAERAARALNELRQAERDLQSRTPEGQQRALGNLQFEARELAEAQRNLGQADQGSAAGRSGQPGQTGAPAPQAGAGRGGRGASPDQASGRGAGSNGDAGAEQQRRMAGEQERLAERLERLRDQLEQQGAEGQQGGAGADLSAAAREAAGDIDRQRLVERMQEAADRMQAQAAGESGGNATGRGASSQQQASNDISRALENVADRLAAAAGSSDGESRRLSSQLARSQELRERMTELTRDLERLDREASRGTPSATGQTGAAQQAIEQQLQEARALLEELSRDEPGARPGGLGFTFEGQGMVRSAPGTEAFKQDLSRWEELRVQVTQMLAAAESSVAARLRARQSQDRLAYGLDDRAPAQYQQHVDSYFKALADRSDR